jgi:hypothetical protein
MTHDSIRARHFERLNSYRNSKEFADYYRSIGNQVPEGELPSLIGDRWEIDEETYWEFLEVLPPLAYLANRFTCRNFASMTSRRNTRRMGTSIIASSRGSRSGPRRW